MRPWVWPFTTLLICAAFIVAVNGAHQSGFDAGIKQERDAKAIRDEIMRDIGTCDWAKIMAKQIQCQRQLP